MRARHSARLSTPLDDTAARSGRRLACGLAALAVSGAAVAQTPPALKPTVLVVPFAGSTPANEDLGYAAALRTLAAYHTMGGFRLMHPKQLARALEQRSAPLGDVRTADGLRRAAVMLGAGWALTGVITGAGSTSTIKLVALDVTSGKAVERDLAAGEPMDVIQQIAPTSMSLFAALGLSVAATATPPPLAPMTRSARALAAYGACARVLMQQPVSLRDPVVLDAARLRTGREHCRSAATLDPSFVDARAALGFAYALEGDQPQAERHLASVKGTELFLPDYAMGKFWVLNRFYDPRLAVEWLQQVVAEQPDVLILRGYLGDSLNILGRHDAALEVFRTYLDLVPAQPWVMSRIGYTHAKLGAHTPAVESTMRALRLTPADPELLLEMASRFVDAGRYDDARTVLQRIVADGAARGEVHLRLGYALLLSGNLAEAERELHTALRLATKRSEWRTRGRARYDLAKIWMRQGARDLAVRQLEYALEEGFHDPAMMRVDPDLAGLESSPKLAKITGKVGRSPAYLTPYRTDPGTGAIDIAAAETAPKVPSPTTF